LEIFSTLHLDKKNDKVFIYFFLDKEGIKEVAFNLHYMEFECSYPYFWKKFELRFNWNDDEIESFLNKEMRKYFSLDGFLDLSRYTPTDL
jgi:hypothetical protein